MAFFINLIMIPKLKTIAISLLMASSVFVQAQQIFPSITCTNLKDKTVNLPSDYAGKRTVIALMFSVKADKKMQNWAQPLYNSLVADAVGGMISGNIYNANLCFVGTVKGLAKLALPEMIKKAKKEVNNKYHDNFMYTDSAIDELLKTLSITDKDNPHFFVIETDGKILHHEFGDFSDNKLNEITGALLN